MPLVGARGSKQRNRFIATVLVIATTSVVAGCGDDGTSDDAGVSVEVAWMRPTPVGTATSAVYLTLRSPVDDRLVGVTVSDAVAADAMVHQTVTADGQMSMGAVDALELPAGADVALAPGGHHVMLTDLAAPLERGDEFAITLTFAAADAVGTTVSVRDEAP